MTVSEQPPAILERPEEGVHVAVLCGDAAERQALLAGYLAGALRRGEGAVCVTAEEPEQLRERVRDCAGAALASGPDVEVVATAQSYLREGRFSGQFMVDWLAQLTAAAPAGSELPRQCVAGVLDWVDGLDAGGFDELFRYESTLNRLAPAGRHTLACFYDLALLPAAEVINVLRAHPRVVISGAVWESPFYVDKDLRPLPLPEPGHPAGASD
ncbi:MAG TPA: MEDS domain-containing protein [Sporichthyaceae bacterium]|jgi:hypothetical protein|nr:MEDS domain-containing protein [Sporichthyaceae bacterium]